ncbi:MAG TPA: carbamoyl-phosphate synthase large subunit [Clostridiaceae bacterium]|nr:carbamoyl-phosphate synthase large subunit [Clostridiaceae bacterium]
MPKRQDIKKVMVIGSGPIVIGQAAEFDYAGTQACRALKDENIEVVLINSNPATIMTDTGIADNVYIEPLTVEMAIKIIEKERPDSILPTLGGQTGLNLAMELSESGCLAKYGVKILGTGTESIKKAEDRQEFKAAMEKIGQPCIASKVVNSVADALEFANDIKYPVIVRPAYTLGGTGGGIARSENELREIAVNGLRLSRVHQILIEKCISGWKEIEFEVMRDSAGNAIMVCSMENIDPVGVHTGDSIVVAPAQTLNESEYQMLRLASLKIISELGIEGGCNIQFAVHPETSEYAVIEVNPRVSRSSALASKATGYPIAKISTKIAIGYTLDEIGNELTGKSLKGFEPAPDYIVIKVPKWPFDKFVYANKKLGTQMKATGEVMSISNSIESALMKAIRSLEQNMFTLEHPRYKAFTTEEIIARIKEADTERLFLIAEAIRRNITNEELYSITYIDKFFLSKIQNLVLMEENLKTLSLDKLNRDILLRAKELGFTDSVIAGLTGCSTEDIKALRRQFDIRAAFKKVDTCQEVLETATPYYYSVYDEESEVEGSQKERVLVIGSGPIRIGQGIEFDYCSVHSVWALKEAGYETIIVNNNPETVSTDFDTADRLYFEPLTREDIENILDVENVTGVIVQFGGQTAIKLTKALSNMNVKIWGTQPEHIDIAEDREKFDSMLEKLRIPRPRGKTVFTLDEALKAANELQYPVLVRPSYVLGGQGMEIAYEDRDIVEFMKIINMVRQEHPILIDKYMMGREIEVDAISDGDEVLIPGIMEHLERAGVHSGDSISVYPAQSLNKKLTEKVVDYTVKIARELKVKGLINIQFIMYDNEIYVIEVNPRSSRTIPYISKVTGVPMVSLATKISMGQKLRDFGYGTGIYKYSGYVAVKVPVFSFEKLQDVEISLGPEMKSTGEVLGIAKTLSEAMYKGIIASGIKLKAERCGVLMTVRDTDKPELIKIAEEFEKLGYELFATGKTALLLNRHGIATNVVKKIDEGSPNILDLIESGKIQLVINTPTKGRKPERDGFKIRRKSVESSIPCFTSLDTVKAVIDSIKLQREKKELNAVNLKELEKNF